MLVISIILAAGGFCGGLYIEQRLAGMAERIEALPGGRYEDFAAHAPCQIELV